jgi:hypothetical protein
MKRVLLSPILGGAIGAVVGFVGLFVTCAIHEIFFSIDPVVGFHLDSLGWELLMFFGGGGGAVIGVISGMVYCLYHPDLPPGAKLP